MKQLVDYQLLGYYQNPLPLQAEVNDLINQGYQLYGDPIVTMAMMPTNDAATDFMQSTLYCQALVKYELEK